MLLPTLQNFYPCSDVRNPPRGYPYWTQNFCLYKPCAMCLIWLHFQPCAGSEPDCNCCCCLSNKYTYMQLRSPEVTKVNFHLQFHLIRSYSKKWGLLMPTVSHPLSLASMSCTSSSLLSTSDTSSFSSSCSRCLWAWVFCQSTAENRRRERERERMEGVGERWRERKR